MRVLKAFGVRLLSLLTLAAFIPGGLLAQGDGTLDAISATAAIPRLKITVEADEAALLDAARQAFALHGGYEVIAGTPQFAFRFERNGANGVTAIISSGGQELARESFTGRSWSDALAMAADYTVERTLAGHLGFFRSQVVFISRRTNSREVYASDLLFREPRQVTADGSDCLAPDIAPNGSTVLYTSYYRNGYPDIYRIDLNSRDRKVFASFKGMNTGATYSPQGDRVAMVLSGTGNSELYVVPAAGGTPKRLTKTRGLEADPTWSPDGQRLAFTSDEPGKPQIYTIDANGQNMRRLPTNISGNCSEPAWNPAKPDLIAFTAASGREFEVCLYSFAENKSRVLTKGAGDAVHPTWLRDGRHLIYTERTAQRSRLMILDTLTGKASPLSPTSFRDSEMADTAYVTW